MPQLGDYVVNVFSDDVLLDEYCTEVDDKTGVATTWIESREGYPFGVRCMNLAPGDPVELRLSADGVALDECVSHGMSKITFWGSRVSATEVRPYLFRSGIRATEDYDEDELGEDGTKWTRRGRITLEIGRVQVVGTGDDTSFFNANDAALMTVDVGPAHQKRTLKVQKDVVIQYCELVNGVRAFVPMATFHFKHRHPYWLQTYNIMPRTLEFEMDMLMSDISLDAPVLVEDIQEMRIDGE